MINISFLNNNNNLVSTKQLVSVCVNAILLTFVLFFLFNNENKLIDLKLFLFIIYILMLFLKRYFDQDYIVCLLMIMIGWLNSLSLSLFLE